MRRVLPFVIIGLVLLVAIGAGVYFYQSASAPERTQTAVQHPSPEVTRGSDAVQPPASSSTPTAPQPVTQVTIEEFADFQCPSCATYSAVLKEIKQTYGDRVKIEFYQFPLIQIHPNALPAAWASEAAGLQGKFWEMHDMLFKNQPTWSQARDARPIFIEYARALGLDADRFTKDMYSGQVNRIVQQDMAFGNQLGVNSTPTVLLNGRVLSSQERTLGELKRAIDALLGPHS